MVYSKCLEPGASSFSLYLQWVAAWDPNISRCLNFSWPWNGLNVATGNSQTSSTSMARKRATPHLPLPRGGIWQINHWFPTDPTGPMRDNFSNTHIAADFCVSQNPCKWWDPMNSQWILGKLVFYPSSWNLVFDTWCQKGWNSNSCWWKSTFIPTWILCWWIQPIWPICWVKNLHPPTTRIATFLNPNALCAEAPSSLSQMILGVATGGSLQFAVLVEFA